MIYGPLCRGVHELYNCFWILDGIIDPKAKDIIVDRAA